MYLDREEWALVDAARETVAALHSELINWELVAWTAGNISQRVRLKNKDVMVIKPSGVSYNELSSNRMVVCDLSGELILGEFVPSSDTAAHAYVYRYMPNVHGVVHTHSTYATAWAALGSEIPCGVTMMADEFGGSIPVGPFAIIGDDSIGRGIVETLGGGRSRAVLMRQHGPFTIGRSAHDAVKAAVMLEDVARTMGIASTMGQPAPLADAVIDQLYLRYQTVYGQGEGAEGDLFEVVRD
jgi:L-ribulose-5-phosphate 4-epimerase